MSPTLHRRLRKLLTYAVFAVAGALTGLPYLGTMAEVLARSLGKVNSLTAIVYALVAFGFTTAIFIAPFAAMMLWNRRIAYAAVLTFAPYIAFLIIRWPFNYFGFEYAPALGFATPVVWYAGLWLAYAHAPRISCRIRSQPRA